MRQRRYRAELSDTSIGLICLIYPMFLSYLPILSGSGPPSSPHCVAAPDVASSILAAPAAQLDRAAEQTTKPVSRRRRYSSSGSVC